MSPFQGNETITEIGGWQVTVLSWCLMNKNWILVDRSFMVRVKPRGEGGTSKKGRKAPGPF